MKFLEKDLEDIICKSFTNDYYNGLLVKKGLDLLDRHLWWHKRQLRIYGCGIADLVISHRNPYHKDNIHVNVIELKRGCINGESVLQCNKYIDGISKYLDTRGINHTISGTLIGDRLNISSTFLNRDDLFYMSFYTYSYDIDGIEFIKHEM